MWTSRRAVSLHVALIVFVPACVALTWWQVSRALGGNTLSWVYTVEWPIFGVYAAFMWWKLVHDEPAAADAPGPAPLDRPAATAGTSGPSGPPRDEGEEGVQGGQGDDELAAYNRYLADLNASGRQKRW
jgi:hypothetical protein